MASLLELPSVFLLGCTSFGGPVAYIAYFRERFVQRLRRLSSDAYADLVAVCQFMPGLSSSQLGMGIAGVEADSFDVMAIDPDGTTSVLESF